MCACVCYVCTFVCMPGVYNVDQRTTQSNRLNVTFFRMLQPHRESIRCLVAVSGKGRGTAVFFCKFFISFTALSVAEELGGVSGSIRRSSLLQFHAVKSYPKCKAGALDHSFDCIIIVCVHNIVYVPSSCIRATSRALGVKGRAS